MNCSSLFSLLFDRLRIGFLSMANVQRIIPFQMYIFVLYLKIRCREAREEGVNP